MTSACGCMRGQSSVWLHERTVRQRRPSQADGLSQLGVMRRLQTAVWIKQSQQLDAEEHLRQTVHRQAYKQYQLACQSARPLPWKPPLPGHCRCAADLPPPWLPSWALLRCKALLCGAACEESNWLAITWTARMQSRRPQQNRAPAATSQARIAKDKTTEQAASSLPMGVERRHGATTMAAAPSATRRP